MFFTPELLTRRDSGFGLLWLAATLGSKSTFKKLPRRSVLTADISQLCNLIAEPAEPLALRLSSNLMVGVARVYKVKQEILLSDVTSCFNLLKKAFQELGSKSDEQLQMAQPSARPGTLTLVAHPMNAYALDFDDLVADWDEFLNIREKSQEDGDGDADFDPKAKKGKQKAKPASLSFVERPRANAHTLDEHPELLLSASFDASFQGSGRAGGWDLSSSQLGGGFGFDDNIFGGDDLDVSGGIGDELARELGEGWGAPPSIAGDLAPMDFDGPNEFNFDMGMDMNADFDGGLPLVDNMPARVSREPRTPQQTRKLKRSADSEKENIPPVPIAVANAVVAPSERSSPAAFARMFLAHDDRSVNGEGLPAVEHEARRPARPTKKAKLLLDPRIELTDEELRTARAQYIQDQKALRREIELKRSERESNKLIEDMVFSVPSALQAQSLIEFWSENFRVQVEARVGSFDFDADAPRAKRRRKTNKSDRVIGDQDLDAFVADTAVDENAGPAMDMGMDFDFGMDVGMDMGIVGDTFNDHRRSSEEPGQARRASRPPSVIGEHFGFRAGSPEPLGASQHSSMFPWDHAGPSSSVTGAAGGGGSDRLSIDRPEIRMRGSSQSRSRRESSLGLSQLGSVGGAVGFSPSIGKGGLQLHAEGEDFAFDVPADISGNDVHQSDLNVLTLEKHSLNFFEYAKMLNQSLPNATSLAFDHVVPRATSTRHVAAAAFYHCLVLATKDLLRLNQLEPYGSLTIGIL